MTRWAKSDTEAVKVMNIGLGELFVLMGVPSAITGLCVWALKRWIEKKDKAKQAHDDALTQILIAQVMCNNANLSLSEAIANAVARIPDAHCNGDMHDALQTAKEMKHRQRELLTELGVTAAVD